MLVQFPEGTAFNDDEWIHVKGTLSTIYYQPFKATLPILIVDKWSSIAEPEDPYTFRMN